MSRKRLAQAPEVPLHVAAKVRVIYGDTDRMGVVYHATYLRYLEHARVEFIRSMGFAYADLERQGVGLPVTDLSVTYHYPATYDDIVTIEVGLLKLSWARLQFAYRLTVQPGDRHDFDGPEPLLVLHAQTFHGCLDMEHKRATRLPEEVYDLIEAFRDKAVAEAEAEST